MIVPEQSTGAPDGVTRCNRTTGELAAEHTEPLAIAVDALTVEPMAAHGPVAVGTGVGVGEVDELPQAVTALSSQPAASVTATRLAPALTPR